MATEVTPYIQIKRRFTAEDQDVYDTVEWVSRDAEIPNDAKDGFVFQQRNVRFPETWSQRAVNIVASKYFYGSPTGTPARETSLKQLIERVVSTITEHGSQAGYFGRTEHWSDPGAHAAPPLGPFIGQQEEGRESEAAFADELRYILLHQMASFNSPVWFNIGVEGVPQQASACYINHLEDSMESILELAKTEGLIFKRGSGAGVNVSVLRPEGAPLSGGGTASGPISFMRALDAQAGVIKSGGVTRRAAKMIVMDADHPDIHEFIWCKIKEERKAKVLIAAGYDSRLDGEAYGTVAFQNANHSVRCTDTNMGRDKEIITAMAEAAWECGDPGVQFTDTINTWHTCPNTGPITATNPCSEFVFLDNTACNLASINLAHFMDEDHVNWQDLEHVVRVLITAMDILCDLADYPTPEIAEATQRTRPLGLGFANLGAQLMRYGIPYDSEQGRKLAASIMSFISSTAYQQSAELARTQRPFREYEKNKNEMLTVIERHHDACMMDELGFLREQSWKDARELGKEHGFRNAQVTVLAPTGTISFMMDCETTGIEPLLAPKTYKTLVGGGILEQEADCYKEGLARVKDPSHRVLATSIGENRIDWFGHLEMVAAVQPYISGAVSKTINMDSDATVEDIEQVYRSAWNLGVKCVSVYRDGCKSSQPLTTKAPTKASQTLQDERSPVDEGPDRQCGRIRLPDTRQAVTHRFTIGGHKGYLTVGLYEDGRPGEIFVTMAKEGSTISGLLDAWAVGVSLMLQYGIPLSVIASKNIHSRYEPSGFTGNQDIPSATSVTDYVMRWMLTNHATPAKEEPVKNPKGVVSGNTCTECGALMIVNGTCHACVACGSTTGCG